MLWKRLVISLFRIVLMTFVFSGLTMAVGLMCGLLVVVVGAALQGAQPDVAMAYRNVAIPLVKVAAVLAFLGATVTEVRYFRRPRQG